MDKIDFTNQFVEKPIELRTKIAINPRDGPISTLEPRAVFIYYLSSYMARLLVGQLIGK